MEQREVIVVGDDDTSVRIRHALADQNIRVLTSLTACGLSVEQASMFCTPLEPRKARAPAPLTDEDRRRMAAAEEKRQRRAAKRSGAPQAEVKEGT